MTHLRCSKRVLSVLAVVAVAACTENSGPGGVENASLSFVRQDTTAPPLLAARDSFWAKAGAGREIRLFYEGTQPGDTGEEFLRFEVSGDGLYRRPNGTAFQTGDSILITVAVVDPARFVFEFEPAGLVFNPQDPARLRVRYFHGDHDYDDDGDEDEADEDIETELDLWYRQSAGALWFRVGSVQFEESDEIDGLIRTFSQYAVAW
jgi:hypothetical protein